MTTLVRSNDVSGGAGHYGIGFKEQDALWVVLFWLLPSVVFGFQKLPISRFYLVHHQVSGFG